MTRLCQREASGLPPTNEFTNGVADEAFSAMAPLARRVGCRDERPVCSRDGELTWPDQHGCACFPLATSAIAPLCAKAEDQGSGEFSPL